MGDKTHNSKGNRKFQAKTMAVIWYSARKRLAIRGTTSGDLSETMSDVENPDLQENTRLPEHR